MTEHVDTPLDLFATLDCDSLDDDEFTFRVPESIEPAQPVTEDGEFPRKTVEWTEVTATFDTPHDEREAAALSELFSASVEVDYPPFDPAATYRTITYEFHASWEQVGYECVQGELSGFVVMPSVEVVHVPVDDE